MCICLFFRTIVYTQWFLFHYQIHLSPVGPFKQRSLYRQDKNNVHRKSPLYSSPSSSHSCGYLCVFLEEHSTVYLLPCHTLHTVAWTKETRSARNNPYVERESEGNELNNCITDWEYSVLRLHARRKSAFLYIKHPFQADINSPHTVFDASSSAGHAPRKTSTDSEHSQTAWYIALFGPQISSLLPCPST